MDMPVRKKFSRSVTKAAHESRARVTERAITPVKASRFELATRPIPGKKNGEREKKETFCNLREWIVSRRSGNYDQTRFKPHKRIARCSDYISRIVCYIYLPCIICLRNSKKRNLEKDLQKSRNYKKLILTNTCIEKWKIQRLPVAYNIDRKTIRQQS